MSSGASKKSLSSFPDINSQKSLQAKSLARGLGVLLLKSGSEDPHASLPYGLCDRDHAVLRNSLSTKASAARESFFPFRQTTCQWRMIGKGSTASSTK